MDLSVRTCNLPLKVLAVALKFLEGLLCSLENLLPEKQVHQVGTDFLTATGHADLLVCLHCTPRKQGHQHESHCTGPTHGGLALKVQESVSFILKCNYILAARETLRFSFYLMYSHLERNIIQQA